MFKNKKAQGLSLNTIVIAAIVLIVLVVLILIFTGRMGDFITNLLSETEKTCSGLLDENGQTIVTQKVYGLKCDTGYIIRPGKYSDLGDGQICCVQLPI